MKNKFKVGDVVIANEKSNYCFTRKDFKGVVLELLHNDRIIIRDVEDNTIVYVCHIQYFDLYKPKTKVVFHKNKTILIFDNKTSIAKCSADDKFDKEKGLLIALAKHHGYTYKDIQEMLADSIDKKDKIKVGDIVRFKSWEQMVEQYGKDFLGEIDCHLCFTQEMKYLCGTTAKVVYINGKRIALKHTKVDSDSRWLYSIDMVDKVN